jgi:hypothetical protein
MSYMDAVRCANYRCQNFIEYDEDDCETCPCGNKCFKVCACCVADRESSGYALSVDCETGDCMACFE